VPVRHSGGFAPLRPTSLQKLDLGSNNIGAEGAASLADALKANTSLQILDLRYNVIGASGAAGAAGAAALADALKANTSLQTLYLGVNNIGTEGAAAIADALKVNCTLLQLDGVDSDEITAALARNKELAESGRRTKAARHS
jgi:Ran GTPase-activating protein (RanGAP) involved in mRNA processing and transport